MARICFVTVCKGRLDDLRQSLSRMVAQPESACVVVDDACPDRSGDWVEAQFPGVRVVRRTEPGVFQLSATRNAGARATDTPWLGFVDADVLLDPDFAVSLFPRLAPGHFFRAEPVVEGIGGTFLCARADFDRAGGFDEAYHGWGEEDNDFYDALRFVGASELRFPADLLRHLSHDDRQRVQFLAPTDLRVGHAVNRVYRILKWDVARVRGHLLTPAMRMSLYAKVRDVVAAAVRDETDSELEVRLPKGLIPGRRSLSRTLSYRLTKDV